MFTEREILSVVEMLKNENLDVRTVTLGLNLLDCASDDIGRFTDNIYARITGASRRLVTVCDDVGDKFGIPVVNKRISVSPMAVAAAPFDAKQMTTIARTLNEAASAARVDFIGGFSALVEKGLAKGDRALIEAIPTALTETERVCASVNVASTRAGINMDAVMLMGRTIKEAARLTADRDGLACAKLCVFANIPQDIPFMAGGLPGDRRSRRGHQRRRQWAGRGQESHRSRGNRQSGPQSGSNQRDHQTHRLQGDPYRGAHRA